MGKVKEPETPKFPYKHQNIPIVENYNKDLGDEYWGNWEGNPYNKRPGSWISWVKLNEEAESCGYPYRDKKLRIQDILENGATLGCEGTGRLPSRVGNSPTVAANGSKVADTLQGWLKSKIIAGPFKESEMPFEEFKVSPMSVRPKPGGKIRLIMDLSAPHGVELGSPEPNSVNKCIDKKKLRTKMSSIKEVCEKIFQFGYPLEMCKADWNNAYKHISICHEDRNLQVVEFGGRYFIETQLTFGSGSSPDRFDLVSDMPIEIALMRINQDRNMTIKQLDDVVGFGLVGTGLVGRFYEEYRGVCARTGVSLAGEEDPEKAFGPSRKGVVLGVDFNLITLEWAIPPLKGDRLLALLWEVYEEGGSNWKGMERLTGKLNHYMTLVYFGRWECAWILASMAGGDNHPEFVRLGEIALQQLKWWIKSIELAKIGSKITDPRTFTPRIFLAMYPDAAGISDTEKLGFGSWFMTSKDQPWVQEEWPEELRGEKTNSKGVGFKNKLTTLEAYAAIVGFVSEPDLVGNKRVVIKTDNAGFVFAYAKATSRCLYAHTLCKALHYVAASLNSTLIVEKTPRRSGKGEEVADELSKGNVSRALEQMDDPMPSRSGWPKVLRQWIKDPYPSRRLGEAIVDELATYTSVLEWGQF